MNKKQLGVLWITIVTLVLLSLFPICDAKFPSQRERAFLYDEPRSYLNGQKIMKYEPVDLGVMVAGMLPFILVGSGLIITLRDKKE